MPMRQVFSAALLAFPAFTGMAHAQGGHGTAFADAGFGGSALAAGEGVSDAVAPSDDGAGGAIVVTGTRRANVTSLESAAPVDVIGESAIKTSGVSRLSDLIQKLSPSFNSPEGGFVNNGVKAATLRGLSADQVLVLVNGKRRHAIAGLSANNAQPVDLNTVPISAIDHIEILRDGASAQYGSDAVAGVINVVLKKADDGGNLTAQYGFFDADSSKQRGSISGWKGFRLGETGFLTLAFDAYRDRYPVSGLPYSSQWYFAGDPREATAPKDQFKWGQPPSRDTWNILANTGFSLSDKVFAYGTVSWTQSRNVASQNYILPNSNNNVRSIYPDGFQPIATYRNRDYSLLAGLKLADEAIGNFDLSVSYGQNRLLQTVSPSVSPTFGVASETSFDIGKRTNSSLNVGLDYVKQIPVSFLDDRALNLSGGVFWREDQYKTWAGDYQSYADGGQLVLDGPNAGQKPDIGSRGNTGLFPEDAVSLTRHVKGAYLGLEFNLLKALEIGLTGRFDDYSDAGSTTNGKVSLRYKISPALALRGSVSTGFRAPALAQSGYAFTGLATVIGSTEFVTTRGLPVNSPAARALGAQDLKPERATDISAGFVLTPIRNGSLTVDLYRIGIDDRIVLIDDLQGAFVKNVLTSAGYPNIDRARFFANGVDTRTKGIDVVGAYSFDLAESTRLNLSAAYSYADTKVRAVAGTPPVLANSGLTLIGRTTLGIIQDYAPKDKLVLNAALRSAGWDATIGTIRFGSFKIYSAAGAASDQTYGAQWVTDAEIGYRVTPDLRVGVGARNLFNSYPDEQIAAQRTLNQTEYSAASPAGYSGALYYINVGFDF